MPIRIQPVLAEAWALFRRDRDWLLAVAGPFLFLPSFALALFVPAWPAAPDGAGQARDARLLAWADGFTAWAGEHGVWYVLAYLVTAFGTAALYAAYLDRASDSVRDALGRAGALLPRYLFAAILVAIPVGAGLFLWILPGVYLMGRTMLTGPALLAERPIAAATAVARSFSLTSGAGLPLMALAAITMLVGVVAGQPFLALKDTAGASPLTVAIGAAGVAGVSMLTGLAQALIAVSAYRRLVAR
ncbi:hypothetical protein [Sphingomonas lenta]|uniref:Uncharacterized protein n=1 Tax=Sphingomonas lenta TaxID=1141887 RepID=A0A2A2SJI9_9SPHN|nr:hypothetical protein [Sphingomonas lenta]PAX09437.1 hypothetical protein CKY28_01390 [Sphingomonas lenta]